MGICDGRVVIVTGAGGGLGRAHALAFAAEGARVVVNDIGTSREGEGTSTGPAQSVVDEIVAAGGEAVANTDDVADWDGAESLVRTAVDAFGGLDVLVNNAGFLRDRMLISMSIEEWDAVNRVHLRGHFCPLRHAGAYWREQSKAGAAVDARIINTSSGAGLMGSVGQGNYSAAKAGIVGMTKASAKELAHKNVRVNAIQPGLIRTAMTEAMSPEVFAEREAAIPMKRAGEPREVAGAALFLASDLSSYMTGGVLEVGGGRLM